jgi:(S)-3,5-dihydroxyphenylglycine transaminase
MPATTTHAPRQGSERGQGVRVAVRRSLTDPSLGVMNFLNEVVSRFPDAVSFAPGRPWEELFDVEAALGGVGRWAEHQAAASGVSRQQTVAALGQYGRTNGIIHEAIARHLERDEGIVVPPRSILVTCGCQEAMAILLAGLFEPGRDALLVSDPTYIGITGLARILEIDVRPVPCGDDGLDPDAVAAAAAAVRRDGLRPRALYDIPDFNNPLGTSVPEAARRRLLEVARQEELLVFEDNPYRMFAYDGPPLPTLKVLDEPAGVVVYLGSFSKTLFPGLRLGFLVADQAVEGGGAEDCLADALSPLKSLLTVNTPAPLQAAAGGILLDEGFSLQRRVDEMIPFYRRNRDAMLSALERSFTSYGLADRVRWNRPGGGFFLTVNLPFEMDEAAVESAARDYGVIVCPMSFFALAGGRERQVRLSFSYVSPRQIEAGVERLARFVAERVA